MKPLDINIKSSLLIFYACIFLFSAGCSKEKFYTPEFSSEKKGTKKNYIFAIHPLYNPDRLYEIFNPMIEYLNKNIKGYSFVLETSRDYSAFENKLYKREYDFALPNPYQTLIAIKKGYIVFGKMGDDFKFTGLLLIRKDSGIKSVADLKGKTVSYPSATALAACMMPQYYLKQNGLDINKDIQNIFVGSQESSIMSVYLKKSAAGATWPVPWAAFQKTYPERAAELETKWETTSLINNSLMYRDDIDPVLAEKMGEIIFNMNNDPSGKDILGKIEISRFEKASNMDYEKVRYFLDNFSKEVRPLAKEY